MSQDNQISRKLVAVFAADVEGYSRLMGADEVGTLKGLTERRAILDQLIWEHRGRIANTAGDSVLAEFGSAVDAVRCAVEAQSALAEANGSAPPELRIQFRMGIHIGDVMVRNGDLFGDGVNIAARLQTLAKPGSVFLSGITYDQVRKVVQTPFADLGLRQLKNIQEPIRVYQAGGWSSGAGSVSAGTDTVVVPFPDKPSVAVLPFQNMSGDPEQEYFADGIVEDIITALSRFRGLFVVARNSSFTYKGKAIDIRQAGRELGVRYLLEGSVRKSGERVRITGQLIDCFTGTHVWADRYDGRLEDVFELQDQVTSNVVGQLVAQVELAEAQRAKRKPTTSLDAYDCLLRGRASIWKWTKASTEEAQLYFAKAIELDPDFAVAHAFAGQMYTLRKQNRWMADVEKETAEGVRLARQAIDLGPMDDLALCMGGFVLAYVGGELDLAADCIARGLSLNPNLALGWNFSGWVNMYLGHHATAIEHARRAERLSPRDPNLLQVKAAMAFAQFFDGQYAEAGRLAQRMADEFPGFAPATRIMAVSFAMAGSLELAENAAKMSLELDPSQRVEVLRTQMPLRRVEDRMLWEEGLLRAGFPQ